MSGGSSVLIGTGITPARSAPQNAIGKSTVSSITSAMRRSRSIPAAAQPGGEPRGGGVELGIGQAAPRVGERRPGRRAPRADGGRRNNRRRCRWRRSSTSSRPTAARWRSRRLPQAPGTSPRRCSARRSAVRWPRCRSRNRCRRSPARGRRCRRSGRMRCAISRGCSTKLVVEFEHAGDQHLVVGDADRRRGPPIRARGAGWRPRCSGPAGAPSARCR